MEISTIVKLIEQALDARKKAYIPYSHHSVGAALLTKDGTIYQGCNIENAGYSATNCAERTAVFKAVSEGVTDFKAIAVVGGLENRPLDYCAPCGVCRQVLREFVAPQDFVIILARSVEEYQLFTLEELLPMSFGPENLC